MTSKAIIGTAVVVVIIAAALGGFFYYDSTASTGHMAISVADTPVLSDVGAVYISFSAVELHSNTSGWTNYTVPSTTINILGLTATNASLLTNVSLHSGTYTTIRLFIKNVTVEVLGANISFTMASNFAFINHPFTVSAKSTTGIIIDFNLNQDLNLNSKVFTPNVGFVLS